jgi:hypothetical protein
MSLHSYGVAPPADAAGKRRGGAHSALLNPQGSCAPMLRRMWHTLRRMGSAVHATTTRALGLRLACRWPLAPGPRSPHLMPTSPRPTAAPADAWDPCGIHPAGRAARTPSARRESDRRPSGAGGSPIAYPGTRTQTGGYSGIPHCARVQAHAGFNSSYGGLAEERARDRQALLLPSGDLDAALADLCLVAVGWRSRAHPPKRCGADG